MFKLVANLFNNKTTFKLVIQKDGGFPSQMCQGKWNLSDDCLSFSIQQTWKPTSVSLTSSYKDMNKRNKRKRVYQHHTSSLSITFLDGLDLSIFFVISNKQTSTNS